MSDMIVCLNDLTYIPPNNKQNEPTQVDIGGTSNEPNQAKRNEFKELFVSANEELCPGTDIAKISRKRSKPDKHGHGNGRAHKEPGECYQKSIVVNSKAQECHITDCYAGNPYELRFDLTDHNGDPIIERNGGTGFKGACEGLDT
ncbi:hypothetical protein Tco_1192815 [Tanacetum coccineum]